jgi:hypothetical protein
MSNEAVSEIQKTRSLALEVVAQIENSGWIQQAETLRDVVAAALPGESAETIHAVVDVLKRYQRDDGTFESFRA